jgi:hypothetical protein
MPRPAKAFSGPAGKQDEIAQLLFGSDGPVTGYETWNMHVKKVDTQDGETSN